MNSTVTTTHFDYHSISGRLLKLDLLGHDDPTVIRMLYDLTGVNPQDVPLGDPETMSLFESPKALGVTEEEINEAYENVDPQLLKVIRKSLVNIRDFHSKQLQNSWFTSGENGTILGQKVTPLDKVGVYVPGGKAVYPSSVLMNVVPAKVAGVPHIYMTTPPDALSLIHI